jgi:hypothetical protein
MRFHRNVFSREGYQVFLLHGLLLGAIQDFDLGLGDGLIADQETEVVDPPVIFEQLPEEEIVASDDESPVPKKELVYAPTDCGCGAPICTTHPYRRGATLPEGVKYEPGVPGAPNLQPDQSPPKSPLPCVPGAWVKENYADDVWEIMKPFIKHAPTILYNFTSEIRKTFYKEGIEYLDWKQLNQIAFRWIFAVLEDEFIGPRKTFIPGRLYEITRNKLVDFRRSWDKMVKEPTKLAEERRVRRAERKKDRDPLVPIRDGYKERDGLHFYQTGRTGRNHRNQEDHKYYRRASLMADVLDSYMPGWRVPAFIWALIKPLVHKEIFADIFLDPFYATKHRREVLMLCYGAELTSKETASKLELTEEEVISIRKSAAEHMRTYVSRRPALQARVKMIDDMEHYATEGTSLYAREVFNAYLDQQDQKEIWLPGADRLREFWAKEDYTQDED